MQNYGSSASRLNSTFPRFLCKRCIEASSRHEAPVRRAAVLVGFCFFITASKLQSMLGAPKVLKMDRARGAVPPCTCLAAAAQPVTAIATCCKICRWHTCWHQQHAQHSFTSIAQQSARAIRRMSIRLQMLNTNQKMM